ncbi:hypothetical protein A3H89_04620 [Candidatus Amesbacteria bacterium RIFCSPLOWO2_02_FULL_48_11]|uniref:Uncharacterized protein n=2 Tax=Candidatus Amesiibacteriota TaxID=1752730 RepID=A0A1F4Z7M5_9BACT|nr:MAG: hypothetical protein UY33_C0003G0037 [Candidatus Amesbacteria bacterium GW2011_GWA1_48_9]OGC91253.1 MAG: hypothetical protein A2V48_02345 [Candidatus Amesbacteria bacterium RBG_19FT_COMBO_48_16]OGC97278.1 MAG: hypothetical protein A3C34_04535 [Candidatus Amesbacteria bacterium RIFCSPHIGHO2_02_FULL_48_21]OGC99249.1 MAG: hypothetical protein A2W16_02525 [Candidatus Amesbacteria bacterium RBG_16_48_31]OGD00356.1 MAG: hypothetical protein A2702_00705 [Candidatus Amesbacteria bacterium RIFCS
MATPLAEWIRKRNIQQENADRTMRKLGRYTEPDVPAVVVQTEVEGRRTGMEVDGVRTTFAGGVIGIALDEGMGELKIVPGGPEVGTKISVDQLRSLTGSIPWLAKGARRRIQEINRDRRRKKARGGGK